MRISASAPGKVVLLGEYVVLDGARALVMATRRRCLAEISEARGETCTLTTRMPAEASRQFRAGQPSGAKIVDLVAKRSDFSIPWPVWSATIDSSAFFDSGIKLGLGSSAAALTAFAGAAWGAAGQPGLPAVQTLIDCHRAFQGGAGSGIDVAASRCGGCLEFRLSDSGQAETGSVRLPKSVGFAGVFAGGSASTPDLVGVYRRWADSGAARADKLKHRLFGTAADGCVAAEAGDGAGFVAAIAGYGDCLAELGRVIGADIVTAEHRRIGTIAARFGLAYKVSGAGGGDVGIACGLDKMALQSFSAAAANEGFRVVPLEVDKQGLRVEEHAE